MESSSSSSSSFLLSIFAASSAVAILVSAASLYHHYHPNDTKKQRQQSNHASLTTTTAYESCIGNTPCILLPQLSRLLRCEIHVKLECQNPGGTGKDRVALAMIRRAEQDLQARLCNFDKQSTLQLLKQQIEQTQQTPQITQDNNTTNNNDRSFLLLLYQALQQSRTGAIWIEGTSGSTGISLAGLVIPRGYALIVVMPDDQSTEKVQTLQSLGAIPYVVPTHAIAHPHHYVNLAHRWTRIAQQHPYHIPAVFGNQFENPANWQMHYETTGPEILTQVPHMNAFVMSAGTGGTIAGISRYLKEQTTNTTSIDIVLVDPPGSSLYNYVEHGVAYHSYQSERTLQRHRYDTIAEGIGLDRLTYNFQQAIIDHAIRVTDQEAVDMAHWILQHEGLWIGSSSAMNLVGAVRWARRKQVSEPSSSSCIVTILCDHGQRHASRFWNREFITQKRGLQWPSSSSSSDAHLPECLQGLNLVAEEES
jgi:cysteine synthase A